MRGGIFHFTRGEYNRGTGRIEKIVLHRGDMGRRAGTMDGGRNCSVAKKVKVQSGAGGNQRIAIYDKQTGRQSCVCCVCLKH